VRSDWLKTYILSREELSDTGSSKIWTHGKEALVSYADCVNNL